MDRPANLNLPWTLREYRNAICEYDDGHWLIPEIRVDVSLLRRGQGYEISPAQAKEIAHFIQKAGNHHHALVEALEESVRTMEKMRIAILSLKNATEREEGLSDVAITLMKEALEDQLCADQMAFVVLNKLKDVA